MVKDRDEQSGKEIHRTMAERVPSVGASVPMELRCITILVRGCAHAPGSSLNPVPLRF